jgi:hypothetical protein
MSELSASALADLAGVTAAEVERMVDLGILVARDGTGPFLETDVQRVRLVKACEQAGLPMDGIATAIRAGRLSFAFLEAQQYQRYAARSAHTYRQVSQETGVPLELLGRALESAGFAWSAPDDPIREDELELVPVLQLVAATGILDLAWTTRIGRAWADGMRLVAKAENEAYHARFELPVLESGMGQRQALELAAQLGAEFLPLMDRAVMAIYRRQQELAWIEDQVEHVEAALAKVGAHVGAERVPAMCFWTWPATPSSPRSAATRPRPPWSRPWPCWSAAPPVLMAACPQVAGRRGDVPLPRTRRRRAGRAGHGGGAPGGWAAAGPCRGGRRAGGGPRRRLFRSDREPGRPDRRPRRRRAGAGEPERDPGLPARRRSLRPGGAGTAQGVRPTSTGC